jgi:AraC-like DNA-binding protein
MPSNDISSPKIFHYRMDFPPDDAESFEAYRGMLAPLFDTVRITQARLPLQATADTFLFDNLILTHQRCANSLMMQRSQRHAVRSGVDEIIVVIYRDGHHKITIDGESYELVPGDIVVYDFSRAVMIETEPSSFLSLTINRQSFERHLPSSEAPHGMIVAPGAVRDILTAHLNQLLALGPNLPQADSATLSEMTLALLAAALRSIIEPWQDRRTSEVTMSALKAAIEQGLSDPDFGAQTLIEQFGLSRSTLYRRFEPLGGVTAYIQERRLRNAFRAIIGRTEVKIRLADLADRHGFASPNAFSQSFRQLFGMTPSQARALAWKPVDAFDTPWRLPKLTERFVRALNEDQEALVAQLVER